MTRQTRFASLQADDLLELFRDKQYYAAYQNLLNTIAAAADLIEAAPVGGELYPALYPDMAK